MLEIVTLTVTPFAQNCRLLGDSTSSSAVVVDPGGEHGRILKEAKKRGWQVKEIWLTHSHIDHCAGVGPLKATTQAKLLGHRAEAEFRSRVHMQAQMYGLPASEFSDCPEPDQYLAGGETLDFAGHQFKVMFTPGHSPGHVVFYQPNEKLLLAGDTLFQGSIGRTDLPGGDHEQLMESIYRELLVLPDDTRVLSGHGPDTTIGEERRTNPYLTE